MAANRWPKFDDMLKESPTLEHLARAYKKRCEDELRLLDEQQPEEIDSELFFSILKSFSAFALHVQQIERSTGFEHPQRNPKTVADQMSSSQHQDVTSSDNCIDSDESMEENPNAKRSAYATKSDIVFMPSELTERGQELRLTPFFSLNTSKADVAAFLKEQSSTIGFQNTLSSTLKTNSIVSITARPAGQIEIEFDSYDNLLAAYAHEGRLWVELMKREEWYRYNQLIYVNIPRHSVVVHGVPVRTFNLETQDGHEDVAAKLLQENLRLRKPEVIREVRSLNPDNQKDRQSLVIGFSRPENADIACRHGLTWNGEKKRVVVYDDNRHACANCFSFKHSVRFCTDPTVCGRCGDLHPTDQCPPSAKVRCKFCKAERETCFKWQCPVRIAAENDYSFRRSNDSRKYLTTEQFRWLTNQNNQRGKQIVQPTTESSGGMKSPAGLSQKTPTMKTLLEEKRKAEEELAFLHRQVWALNKKLSGKETGSKRTGGPQRQDPPAYQDSRGGQRAGGRFYAQPRAAASSSASSSRMKGHATGTTRTMPEASSESRSKKGGSLISADLLK